MHRTNGSRNSLSYLIIAVSYCQSEHYRRGFHRVYKERKGKFLGVNSLIRVPRAGSTHIHIHSYKPLNNP